MITNIFLLFLICFLIIVILKKMNKKLYLDLVSDKKIWETLNTYWPMNPYFGSECTVIDNLYCKNGCLDKYDKWLKNKNGIESKAREYEANPFFNWLVDKPSGYYIPNEIVKSNNFEKTSGVNINDNGRLKNYKEFELKRHGKNISEIDTYWWGSCELSARANMFFKEPIKVVHENGIEFTPHDIKGLLTVISKECETSYEKIFHKNKIRKDIIIKNDDSRLEGYILNLSLKSIKEEDKRVKNDNYLIKNLHHDLDILVDNNKITIPKEEIHYIIHETKNDINAHDFHKYITKWIKEGPFVLDIDKGNEIWNYCFGRILVKELEISKDSKVLRLLDKKLKNKYHGKIRFINTKLFTSDEEIHEYYYWLAYDWKLDIIDGGWLEDDRPDFIWRCKLRDDWDTIETNNRNPYVLPKYVKELYYKSI